MSTSKAVRVGSAICCLPALLFAHSATAGPAGGVVRGGTATISQTGTATTINQTSARAVIDWRTFDIAANESVSFAQPSATSAVLNRVTGTQFSSLQGSLTANGQVYLVNPNGIFMGSGAHINAGSFVASTANIATQSFMRDPAAASGTYAFDELANGASTGTIVNAGTITVADGGMVALVAPGVRNSGTITARLGTIELASATHFTLDLFGDDLVRLALGDSVAGSLVDTSGAALTSQVGAAGAINADGGRVVLLSVPAASGLFNEAINLSGVARAQSVSVNQRGEISLLANQGVVTLGGTADASSAVSGVRGGDISAIGSAVHVTGTGRVNANGVGGGGDVVLGGTYTGLGTTATAQTTVDFNGLVTACGTAACARDGTGGAGNGGVIRLYSTQATGLAGELSASSGAASQAGTVEMISNLGVTSMASMARIISVTGENQVAGFTAVIGETLDLAPTAFIDMTDIAGNRPESDTRFIYDSRPTAVRNYVFDPNKDPRPTSHAILFHAYISDGVSLYPDHLPTYLADNFEGPVGTLRPNGGAPTTLAASSADALAAIPVSFTAPAPTGADTLTNQVANTANQLTRDATDSTQDIVNAGKKDAADAAPMALVTGGPGVAQVADLGRTGPAAGASPDVFDANFHVLAPAGGADDSQIADYLCLTPFVSNACR
jgi:filamentous hemagglutinin family protein